MISLFNDHFLLNQHSLLNYDSVSSSMSYLRYLCLFAHSGVQHIVLCFCFGCLPYVDSFFELSFFIAPFGDL